ncbi:MAG: hypothetical protein MUF77_06070, partial [Leptospira sp.]|nr:hypothetical protein [Leptospira sp.]
CQRAFNVPSAQQSGYHRMESMSSKASNTSSRFLRQASIFGWGGIRIVTRERSNDVPIAMGHRLKPRQVIETLRGIE